MRGASGSWCFCFRYDRQKWGNDLGELTVKIDKVKPSADHEPQICKEKRVYEPQVGGAL